MALTAERSRFPDHPALYYPLAAGLLLGPLLLGTGQFDAGLPKELLWSLVAGIGFVSLLLAWGFGAAQAHLDLTERVLAGFVLWTAASVGWAGDCFGAADRALHVALAAGLFVGARRLVQASEARRLLVPALVGLTWTVVYACLQASGVEPFDWPARGVFGAFGDPALLGAYLAAAWPAILVLGASDTTGRWMSGTLLSAWAAAIALSGSRVALVAAGAAAAHLLFRGARPGTSRAAALALALAGLVVGMSLVSGRGIEWLAGAGALGARREVSAACVRAVSEHPVRGCGAGNFEAVAWGGGARPDDAETALPPRARSELLQVAVEGGAVGLALFVSFLALALRGLSREGGRVLWATSGVAFVVASALGDGARSGGGLIVGLLALGLGSRPPASGTAEGSRRAGRLRRVVVWGAVLAVLAVATVRPAARAIADRRVASGLDALAARDWFEAFDSFRAALRWQPDNLLAAYSLARVYVEPARAPLREDYGFAESYLRPVQDRAPDYRRIHFLLGETALETRRPEEAERNLRTAAALEPSHAESRRGLGMAAFGQGRRDEAVVHFREAVRLSPKSARLRLYLGNALLRAGDRLGAEAEFRRALVLAPADEDARKSLDEAVRGRR